MKLLDRIALNNLLRIIREIIIRIIDSLPKKDVSPIKPKPNRPRPLKNIIDRIPTPWKKK